MPPLPMLVLYKLNAQMDEAAFTQAAQQAAAAHHVGIFSTGDNVHYAVVFTGAAAGQGQAGHPPAQPVQAQPPPAAGAPVAGPVQDVGVAVGGHPVSQFHWCH
jgi:hypothetical protein